MAVLGTRRILRLILVCFVVTVSTTIAKADWMDGDHLYLLYLGYAGASEGKGPEEREAAGIYFGYVIGVVNATDALFKDKIYCLPPRGAGATNEQLAHVVGAYLTANPSERTEPAMALIFKALKKTFPCR